MSLLSSAHAVQFDISSATWSSGKQASNLKYMNFIAMDSSVYQVGGLEGGSTVKVRYGEKKESQLRSTSSVFIKKQDMLNHICLEHNYADGRLAYALEF